MRAIEQSKPNWEPLVKLVGEANMNGWMWMSRDNGWEMYKDQDSRGYCHIRGTEVILEKLVVGKVLAALRPEWLPFTVTIKQDWGVEMNARLQTMKAVRV